ncbi:MAG: hypothetical protein HND39_07435 [Ignavibacteriota bacterium]|jgi:hypothetical protein|nr:MAG: hypothetical protein EDM72_03330 [Chlorobiota bacterium]MBE7476107.1 hypothetical protein [Ignavibacteriales bacterium]MBL1124098.1 hypothetical protein [Ignavibacteriota bacterium]MBV6421019.1 hypothetical protein [Ignavibacteriaceae bacterium]MCE7857206.1 hypothetical protein [Ignavibacteria bacterium CHB3]MEB2295357.1 hypothetical protein [Ignavibacteria bacterium]
MIAALKEQAARFVVRKKTPVVEFSQRNFASILSRTYSFLVMMPAKESDFRFVFPILEYLREQRKNIVVMTYDYRVSLLQPYFKTNAVEHGVKDETKLNLPSKKLLDKLTNIRFDVIIDANREEVLFYNYIARSLNSQVKIGFSRSDSDKYFNLQVVNKQNDPETSYKNLIDCLKMFQGH